MTEILRQAAHSTEKILALAEGACALLYGSQPRVNAAGILGDPGAMAGDLVAARKLIDDAIGICNATNWPSETDYHAL
jgi:hypothetical protein